MHAWSVYNSINIIDDELFYSRSYASCHVTVAIACRVESASCTHQPDQPLQIGLFVFKKIFHWLRCVVKIFSSLRENANYRIFGFDCIRVALYTDYKKFELMLTRRAKALAVPVRKLSVLSSHFVAVHSWSVHCSRRSQKSIKIPYFGSLGSFKVIDVDRPTTEKLVPRAC